MYEIHMKVEGMHCGMCEAHVNDAVRKAAPAAKKVASSAPKGETTYISEADCSEAVKAAIEDLGYHVGEVTVKQYEKRGLFRRK